MMLYVNGQEITRLVLGALKNEAWVIEPVDIPVPPEGYLAAIDAFLREHTLLRTSITTLVVVRGPGSATSLRTSLSIVNAWGFAQATTIIGIEKPRDEADVAVLARVRDAAALSMVTPFYERPAKITASTKDALGR
ncbi:MAG: hypothetical protein NUV56_01835 [Candidatus Uhrbacteria bacterium]|nr:hypothetical protein [Candidatus Uhrbacteria bacterium]